MPNDILNKKNYLQHRWATEQRRFERQARLNQVLNIVVTSVALCAVVGALVFGTLLPMVQMSLFGAALVAITISMLYDFRERAKRYRGVADALRRERDMYNASAGVYANADKAFTRFVNRCEAIIQASGDSYMPLLVDDADDAPQPSVRTSSSLPGAGSPFGGRASVGSGLRGRVSSSRFATSKADDDDDDDDDQDENDEPRSRFSGSSFSGRSSGSPFGGRSSSPFGNRPANSPFGSGARYSGGRPIGSSGGMRREGNDDPALAGIQTGNGNTGVRFSAYYPKELSPQEWHPLKAYAFMGYALNAVVADAYGDAADKQPEILYDRNKQGRYRIPEGAQVTVTPRMKGFQFNPQTVSIGFYRTWHRFDFEIRAVDAKLDEATNGYLTFTVDGLVVADVPLSVYVGRAQDTNRKDLIRHVTRKPYRGVYASFADEDIRLAQRLQRIYDALGMYTLRDLMQQRSETGWDEGALRQIEDAEVFQLFWSSAAANSATVEQELQHALAHANAADDAVRVVYWEHPPAPLPAVLSHLSAEYVPDIAD